MNGEAQALARVHPFRTQFASGLVPASAGDPRLCVRGPPWDRPVPRVPLPVARYCRQPGDVLHHLRGHYPSFVAHTDSCDDPKLSCRLCDMLVQQVFAGCCQPLLRVGPSRRYLRLTFPGCLGLSPGGLARCVYPFLPSRCQPSLRTHNRSASTSSHLATARWGPISGSLPFLPFRPPGLLATQIASTAGVRHVFAPQGSRGFSFRAERMSLPSYASDMLAV